MPRSFTDDQKKNIRIKLLELGLDLFGQHGFKKVSLDDVVRRVGISKGAFYSFFSSKELYFMGVLEYMESSLRSRYTQALSNASLSPGSRFRLYFNSMFDALESTPLLARITTEDLSTLYAALPEELVQDHIRGDISFFKDTFTALIPSGTLPPSVSESALSGIMQVYFYAFINREKIGLEETKAALDLLTRMLCRTLFDEELL